MLLCLHEKTAQMNDLRLVRWQNMVAFAQLGLQFLLIMDKYLVILDVSVTGFLNSITHLQFPHIFKGLLPFAKYFHLILFPTPK